MDRQEITLEHRRNILARYFAQIHFGHVSTVNKPCWDDLLTQSDAFLASFLLENGKGLDQHEKALEELQALFLSIVSEHPLNRFPVSEKQKSESLHWIRTDLQRTFGKEVDEVTRHDLPDSEYIFKTFDRSDYHVTLLEENREIIGHGTTGLTSWQGGLFLADWAANYGYLLEVRIIGLVIIMKRVIRGGFVDHENGPCNIFGNVAIRT